MSGDTTNNKHPRIVNGEGRLADQYQHVICGYDGCQGLLRSTGEAVPFTKPARVIMECERCGQKYSAYATPQRKGYNRVQGL